MRWDDVNARARGLATHLLDRSSDRSRLLEARTLDQLIRMIREAGYPLGSGSIDSLEEFDAAVGRVCAERFQLLGRWLDRRRPVLAVVYELEDRHALRVLLRGAVQGRSAPARLRTLTPTPDLPRKALEELARTGSPAELAALLLRFGHPAGRALEGALAHPHPPGLLGMELALARTFAARASRAARRGGRVLRAFTSSAIDLENAWTLLEAPRWGADSLVPGGVLPGGQALTPKRFELIARLGEAESIRRALLEVFEGSPFQAVFGLPLVDESGLERRALTAQIDWCTVLARLQPLGPAVVLGVLLRIRAEAHDLRALAWGLALQVPADALTTRLVG